jgi:hypothetical protein
MTSAESAQQRTVKAAQMKKTGFMIGPLPFVAIAQNGHSIPYVTGFASSPPPENVSLLELLD